MRSPAGLGETGKKLWRSIHEVFDFSEEPGKVHLLTQACRVADIIAELDDAAHEAPLTVRGSQGQPVTSPFIAEARVQRAYRLSYWAGWACPTTTKTPTRLLVGLRPVRLRPRPDGKGATDDKTQACARSRFGPGVTIADYFRWLLTRPGAAFEGAVCGVLAAIGGPIVEALLAGVGVFRYADDSNASFGVAPWLPAL